MSSVSPASPSPDPFDSLRKAGSPSSANPQPEHPAAAEVPIASTGFTTNQPIAPSPALLTVSQAVEHELAIDRAAIELEAQFRKLFSEQVKAHPELQKWNTPEFRTMPGPDVQAFKDALLTLETKLKESGFEKKLGMGTTGVIFKIPINDRIYSMKVFITKTDNKGYGIDLNLPFSQFEEVNKLNDINDGLLAEVSVGEKQGRFDFLQARPKLYANKEVLVYPHIDAEPIINGEVHHGTSWEVNQEYLEKGVSPQWISDFLHLMSRAQMNGINMTDFGQVHQTLYKDGKIYLLDPFGSNKLSRNGAGFEKDPTTIYRMKHQSENPLVYPISCLASSISFFEWAQRGNVWRDALLSHLTKTTGSLEQAEEALDAFYEKNLTKLADGIKLAIEDAKHFKGHAEIFTKENFLDAINIVIDGSVLGDEEAKEISKKYYINALTDEGREWLNQLSAALSA